MLAVQAACDLASHLIADAPIGWSIQPTAIVVQQSGAIRIGGGAAAQDEPVVYGFTPDGHDDGLRITGTSRFRQPVQYLTDQGGALVASHAQTKSHEGVLARYAQDGTPDASFEQAAVERAVAMTTDGAFVTAGRSLDEDPRRFLARRVTRDGQVDASFGGGAVVIPDVERDSGEIRVAARSGGGLVMVGVSGGEASKVVVARFDGAGALDPSLGGRGYVAHDLGYATIVAIAELPDGSTMLVGRLAVPGPQEFTALVVRLAPDGSLDASFADGGRFMLDEQPTVLTGLVVMADGEVIAGGYASDGALLVAFPPR
jgi:uncharacterized delta-60 repeat protein